MARNKTHKAIELSMALAILLGLLFLATHAKCSYPELPPEAADMAQAGDLSHVGSEIGKDPLLAPCVTCTGILGDCGGLPTLCMFQPATAKVGCCQ